MQRSWLRRKLSGTSQLCSFETVFTTASMVFLVFSSCLIVYDQASSSSWHMYAYLRFLRFERKVHRVSYNLTLLPFTALRKRRSYRVPHLRCRCTSFLPFSRTRTLSPLRIRMTNGPIYVEDRFMKLKQQTLGRPEHIWCRLSISWWTRSPKLLFFVLIRRRSIS